jgi:hypothetical protein
VTDAEVEAATLRAYRRLLERAEATIRAALAASDELRDPPLDPPPCP